MSDPTPPTVSLLHCECWWTYERACCLCGNDADEDGRGLCPMTVTADCALDGVSR